MNKLLSYWDIFLTAIIRLPKIILNIQLPLTIQFNDRLSVKEQIVFMKRLSMMLRAQMPIVTSLEMFATETNRGRASRIARVITTDVSAGVAFSQALSRYKNVFGFFVISFVVVGERSGTLPESLEYIASELKKKRELKSQIIGALIYPAIVILATLGITLFLILYIFPKIVPIFLSVTTTLPWSTRFLIAVSDFLTSYGWYLVLILTLCGITIIFLCRFKNVHYLFTNILLTLPIIGKLLRYYNIALVTRTLSLLLRTHVPITTGLEITATSTGNIVYRSALEAVLPEIANGKNLASAFAKSPKLFPPLVIQMIDAGERTGNLPSTLAYVSELFEADIRDITKNLTTIIEPVLMLVMGLLVGFIAVSIITPIYGITQNLHQ